MSRDSRLFLQDILDSAARVATYTHGMTQEAFEANGMVYDAVIRNLEVIGEAAKQIPQETATSGTGACTPPSSRSRPCSAPASRWAPAA
jgi:uncharacterized protein with HEPN domain